MKNLLVEIDKINLKIIENKLKRETDFLLNEMKKIGIEKLPYSYSALRQFTDPETMNIHYNKHYKGYVKKLNDALSKKDYGDIELEDIIKNISKYNKTIRNNAGGAFNHALFWNMLSPEPKKLEGKLYDKITKQFGSFSKFKKKFELYAKKRFGSGWVWLVITKRKNLKIMTTPNQDNPLMDIIKFGGFPILGLDLWEHSYYLKYQNERDKYISNFWDVVNWDFVSELYNMKVKTNLLESTDKDMGKEQKKNFCSPKEFHSCKNIMSNYRLRKLYSNGIIAILKKVYKDYWRDKTDTELSGFYDVEAKGKRSILNNLNTNIYGFCMLIEIINNILDKNNLQNKKFDFIEDVNKNEKEIKRFLNALNYYKLDIFTKKNEDFVNIVGKLKQTYKKGEKGEELSLNKIKKHFGDRVDVDKIGGHGSKIDAINGIDGVITLDGIKKTTQIKIIYDTQITDDGIKVLSNSVAKKYPVDWMIFINDKTDEVFIFDNKPTIEDDNYVFNNELLLHHIK